MSQTKTQGFLSAPAAALAGLLLLAGCHRAGEGSGATSPEAAAGYLAAPTVAQARFAQGRVELSGRTAPRAAVRLASPAGEAFDTTADREGRWAIGLPASETVRIFGLSTDADGRRVQAEGYVLVGPRQAALLRPGAGAVRLEGGRLGVTAVDFDRQGSGVVSGRAEPGSSVTLRLDARYAGDGRAGPDGRFNIALPQLSPGPHQLEVAGEGFASAAALDATPPAPLAEGPLRSQFSAAGLRADWLTPGGGVQSTLLPD